MNIDLNLPEYKFLKEDPLNNNIILLGLGGSYAYGTNIETSDIDLRGIATRPKYDILTGKDYEQVVDSNTDTTIYTLDKFLKLAADCNPNIIELLGLRPQDYLLITDIGRDILDNKSYFLSNKCIHTFGGYANSQLYRLKQKTLSVMSEEEYNAHIAKTIQGMKEHLYKETGLNNIDIISTPNGLIANIDACSVPVQNFYNILNEINNVIKDYNKHSKRNEHAIMHDKIEKHAMHLLRLYMMVIDILETGEIITYREKEHDLLMSIRNKEFTDSDGRMNKEFFELVTEYENKFEIAKNKSVLPDLPNIKKIEYLQAKSNFYKVVGNY